MFHYSNITAYHLQLKNNETDCVSAVKFYLNSISENKLLNAFVDVFETEALNKAAELDKKRMAGGEIRKLHGVVIAIKDVICYKDQLRANLLKIENSYIGVYMDHLVKRFRNYNNDEFIITFDESIAG